MKRRKDGLVFQLIAWVGTGIMLGLILAGIIYQMNS
jgi:hypothetical protein